MMKRTILLLAVGATALACSKNGRDRKSVV